MAFTREEMAAYEQQPQTQVPDPVIAKPAALEQETSQEAPAAEAESSAADVSDQTDSGDVTSDEEAAPSTASATDDESEAGETEGEETDEVEAHAEGEESTDQPTKPISRASKRIQELNSKMLEASDLAEGYKEFGKLTQEQLKAAREELAELRAKLKPATPAAEPSPAVADKLGPMPKLTDPDVNFDPDILAAKTEEWTDKKVKLTVAEAIKQSQPDPVKIAAQKAVESFTSKIEDFKKNTPDWDAKVKNPELPSLHDVTKAVIVRSGEPAILYFLGSNIGEAKRIAALPAEEQVLEIGMIKARLETQAGAKPVTPKTPVTGAKPVAKKSVSQAPPPPTPVPAGKRSQDRDMTDPTMDMEAFARKHREGKNNARLAARKMRGLN